jgi:CBS domain-containing protein
MSVGRICVREVHVAAPEEPVREAARRMAERRVGTLVVLDGERRPIGLLTDRDLVVRVVAPGRDPERVTVGEVMTRDVRCASEEMPIEVALSLMRTGPFRRVPVTGRDGRLVGILGLDDVLGLLTEEMGLVGGLLEREAPWKEG